MPEHRKLAAIMFTDIVGYSALMSQDEKLALEVLWKNREIHKSTIEKFNGQYIKEIGDDTLSTFPSSVDAVNCALEIQRLCSGESDFQVRIGIHIGDIIFEDNDVFDDGVNIASRIESSGKNICHFTRFRSICTWNNQESIKLHCSPAFCEHEPRSGAAA